VAETQQVIIEFITETGQLDSAIDQLEKTGAIDSKMASAFKQTNAEISKQTAEIKKAASSTAPLKKNLEDVNKATKKFTQDFMTGFNEGVIETLRDAGVSAQEFANALGSGQTEVEKSSESLRARLKTLTQQIAQMKLAGEDGTEQFKALVIEAGNIKDAMGDAAAEIKNAGSDTRTFDNLLGTAQAVAGGFAVAQGTAALFGDESEELQKTLLKVNAAMAILQGLQQISNALEKEGAITKLGSTIATKGQIAAQFIYNAVVGTSIGLMKALRIAFALTGVGALVLGITALVQWLTASSKATKQLIKDLTAFNDTIEAQVNDLNKSLQQNDRIQAENSARAKARGALQSKINKQEIEDLKSTFDAVFQLESAQRQRAQIAEKTINDMRTGERSFNQEALDEAQKFVDNYAQLQNKRKDIANEIRIKTVENEKQTRVEQLQAIADGFQGRLALVTKNSKEEFDLQKQSARAQAAVALEEAGQNLAKRVLIQRELQKQLRAIDAEAALVRQQDRIAGAERELLAAQQAARAISERGTQDEINAQKRVLLEKTRLDLLQEGLSAYEKLIIWENYLNSVMQLQKEFNNQSSKETLQDLISRNNAELSQLNITSSEKLSLQEENLITLAQIEIDANKGLTDKIKEIRAKLNEDLRALRLAAIEKDLEDELAATEVRTGVLRRANESMVSNESKGLKARITAINQLAALDIAAINKRQDALDQELKDRLISQKEYKDKYAKLVDDETKIVEDAEKKKTGLIKDENIKRVEIALTVLGQIGDLIQSINDTESQKENDRIEGERRRVSELLEAGAITEKEAAQRNKRLDVEEKKAKNAQAKREKDMAIFRALLAIPAAFLNGLSQSGGNPIVGAIYAAIAAAEAIIIASRPIPKFAKGKKDRYEGPGEIGEAGAELMEHNGQLYLAKKRTLVWLGKDDKVYNPTETKEMLMPVVDKQIMQWQAPVQKQPDMKQMAAELAKEIKKMPGMNLSVDEHGFKVWVQEGQSRTSYMDKRYSSK
jgi:hypothetical protein